MSKIKADEEDGFEFADAEPRDVDAPIRFGLVVAERAAHGNDLIEESKRYLMEQATGTGQPPLIFDESDNWDPETLAAFCAAPKK